MVTSFKTRLKNRETLIGPILNLPSADVAEIMSLVGFDYVWIDMEHAPIDFCQAQTMIQAVRGRCACLVRVPENREVWFKRTLDIGCDGIVVPQVKSAEEARRVIECCLYPPGGRRSVGAWRAQGYGMSFQDYVERANEELTIVLQVEHIDGVQNIKSIVDVPGIDAVLIGTADLSSSLNVIGEVTHPQVQKTIEEVRRRCIEAKIPVGIYAADAPSARKYIEEGFSLIAFGIDTFYLWKSAKTALAEVRGESL